MGKALIIKGADFSAVAAQNIVIGGDVELTKTNYASSLAARFFNRKITPDANAEMLFYPIKQGDYLKVPGVNTLYQSVGVSLGDQFGMGDFFGDGGCVQRDGDSFPGDIIIQAPANGYACLISKNSNGDDRFPTGSIITKTKPVTRTAGLDNYVLGANKYLKDNGTWGNDTVPVEHYACLFYNVHAGEVVKITATNGNQVIAFLQMCEGVVGRSAVYTQGSGNIRVTQGDEQSITVEKEALLYVYAGGGEHLQTIEITGV